MAQIRWSACALCLFLCLRIWKWDLVHSDPPIPLLLCLQWKRKVYSYSCQYFPHMSSTRPSLPLLNLLSLSHIISRHKYSVCHSRLCSERPLSAYLYKMWICNSTVMKATLVTSFQHIIFPQTNCETRSNRCVKALFILRGCQEGCGKTQRFAQSTNSTRMHTLTTRFLFYSLFLFFLFFRRTIQKKPENTGVLWALMFWSSQMCVSLRLRASRGSDFCRQFVSGNWSLSTAVECILGTISRKRVRSSFSKCWWIQPNE